MQWINIDNVVADVQEGSHPLRLSIGQLADEYVLAIRRLMRVQTHKEVSPEIGKNGRSLAALQQVD
jgi:hypothetical protein